MQQQQRPITLKFSVGEIQAILAALDTHTKATGLQCVITHAGLLQKINDAAKAATPKPEYTGNDE